MWRDLRALCLRLAIRSRNNPNMDEGSADPHQDRKIRLIFLSVGLLSVALAVALTVAWFMLIGYGVVALLDFIAAGPVGATGSN